MPVSVSGNTVAFATFLSETFQRRCRNSGVPWAPRRRSVIITTDKTLLCISSQHPLMDSQFCVSLPSRSYTKASAGGSAQPLPATQHPRQSMPQCLEILLLTPSTLCEALVTEGEAERATEASTDCKTCPPPTVKGVQTLAGYASWQPPRLPTP